MSQLSITDVTYADRRVRMMAGGILITQSDNTELTDGPFRLLARLYRGANARLSTPVIPSIPVDSEDLKQLTHAGLVYLRVIECKITADLTWK